VNLLAAETRNVLEILDDIFLPKRLTGRQKNERILKYITRK
jgi:hypothetical protein